jgi:chromosome segregation ATPase
MTMDREPRRSLFGLNREDVRRQLGDLEARLEEAIGRAEAAQADHRSVQARLEEALTRAQVREEEAVRWEEEALSLRAEVETLRGRVSELEEELGRLRGNPALAAEAAGDPTLQFLVSGVAPIIRAAEESAAGMLEQVRKHTEERMAEVERVRTQLIEKIRDVQAWGDRVRDVVPPARERIDDTRKRIEETPDRIREALAPLDELFARVGDDLARLLEMSRLAPHPHPPGVDPEGGGAGEMGAGHDRGATHSVHIPRPTQGAQEGHPARAANGSPAGRWFGPAAWWPYREQSGTSRP